MGQKVGQRVGQGAGYLTVGVSRWSNSLSGVNNKMRVKWKVANAAKMKTKVK